MNRQMGRSLAFICLLLFLVPVCARTDQTDFQVPDKATVTKALAKLKAGNAALYDLDILDLAGAVEAIPLLEDQFTRSDFVLEKARIAQVLVHLGDKNNNYWTYLSDLVTPLLGSDEPFPIAHDSQGKEMRGVAPEFEAWVVANKKVPASALADAEYIHPGEVTLLGRTEDPRAIPLLRKALTSRNYLIVSTAAEGLALLKDKDSIPSIIGAADNAPPTAAGVIARALVYFDDQRAQQAVDKYETKEYARLLRDAKAKGQRPLH